MREIRGEPSPFTTTLDSVWALARKTTQVFHSDLDCPAIQGWRTATPGGLAVLMEIDRTASEWAEWTLDKDGWWRSGSEDMIDIDLGHWRSCMRCGSARPTPVAVCAQCGQPVCDCGIYDEALRLEEAGVTMNRTYTVSLRVVVDVDDDAKTVTVTVPLHGLASQLEHAYEYVYPEPHTLRHERIIKDFMLESLEHHSMTHRMERKPTSEPPSSR